MSLTEFAIGYGYFLGMLVPVILAARLIRRRTFGSLTGVPRMLCGALLVLVGIIAVHMVAGVLGILSRPAVLVVSLVAAAVVYWLIGRQEPPVQETADTSLDAVDEPEGPAAWLAAAIVLGTVIYILGYAIEARNQILTGTDALWFHIPGVARWIQTGSFWDVGGTWHPDWAFGHYPQNGNVVQLSFILPWSSDSFVRFVSIPFLGLAGLSVFAIARELRAPRSTSLAAAAAFCAIPVAMRPPLRDAQTDTLLFAAFGIGVLFLIRSSRSGSLRELVLAGLGLGIAFGTKWYAVAYVPLAVVVWAAALLIARRPVRRVLVHGVALCGAVFAAGGFWLIRNLVKSGSPLFPAKVSLGNFTIFDAPPSHVLDNGGYSIAHYLDRPEILRSTIIPRLMESLAVGGVVLGAALLLVGAFVLARRKKEPFPLAAEVLVLAIGGLLLLVAYAFTPFTALGPEGRPFATAAGARYALPALLIGAALAAWAGGRLRSHARTGAVAIGGLLVLDSLRRTVARAAFSISPRLIAYGVAAALLAAFVWAVARRIRPVHGTGRGGAKTAIAGLAVLALMGLLVGSRQERAYNATRYGGADPVFAWIEAHAPSGHRIGLAGRYPNTIPATLPPPLPLHGPRLRNRVVYVGPTIRGLLSEYTSAGPFIAALERGRFELLVIALGDPPRATVSEEGWASDAGFVEVVRSPSLVLLARRDSPVLNTG